MKPMHQRIQFINNRSNRKNNQINMRRFIVIFSTIIFASCESSLTTEFEPEVYDSLAISTLQPDDTTHTSEPAYQSNVKNDGLFFESGFEDSYMPPNLTRILGPTWETFDNSPIVESSIIATEGYNLTAAYPEIVNFEGDNKLHFVIKNKVGAKARAQCSISFNVDTIKEYRSQFKFYLHPDMVYLTNYSGRLEYFSFFEIWEKGNPNWDGNSAGQAYWSLYIMKDAGSNQLYWMSEGDYMQPASVMDNPFWTPQKNRNIPVPIGKWATLDYTFTRGVGTEGHIYITLKVDNVTNVLFDIHNTTTYPNGYSRSVAWYQPFKFYMPAAYIDYLNVNNKKCEVWYDDFKLYLK
jgi:hypothetical protein